MVGMVRCSLIFSFTLLFISYSKGELARWCAHSAEEFVKCQALQASLHANNSAFKVACVRKPSILDCMETISKVNPDADLMRLDAGLAYSAAQLYALKPVVAENYGDGDSAGQRVITFKGGVLVRRGSDVTLNNMKNRRLCSSGVGTSYGWVAPLAELIGQKKTIPVDQCNSIVMTVSEHFNEMCLPGGLNSLFNNFGSNSDKACNLCKSVNDGTKYCSYNDDYAGTDGALRCMSERSADVAFVRIDEVLDYAKTNSNSTSPQIDLSQYQLLCKDGSRADVDASGCGWEELPSALIVTSTRESDAKIGEYRQFLNTISTLYGPSSSSTFKIFQSHTFNTNRRNLMFSDVTRRFYNPTTDPTRGDLSSVYSWIKPEYASLQDLMNYCPLSDIRWCVLSENELQKCERMKLAFSAKNLKPDINCIHGGSAIQCMRYISMGLADIINLDAGDLYVAGKRFGLVPFVAEYYGDSTSYYAVAVVHQNDKQTLVSNMKNKRTCHSGVGKATGWIVPINLVLDTRQITILHCRLMHAFSELVSRACVPGIMENDYNPSGYNPINLCENCAAGGADRCVRTDRELYYGDDGAFRCLVEGAGDVAFTRHTTVFDNTAGHNPTHWARNRRSNDFELLCPDGSRRETHEWANCNLGRIPGNVLVTAGHKTDRQKQTMWQLLKYAQAYYASDSNANNFKMFESGWDMSDLMFNDITESLIYIPPAEQNYLTWLGQDFLQKVETIEWQSCGLHSGMAASASALAPTAAAATVTTAIAVALAMLL